MALFLLLCSGGTLACAQQQKQDTIVVSRDGTGKYRDIQEAVEAVRAFMDYTHERLPAQTDNRHQHADRWNG